MSSGVLFSSFSIIRVKVNVGAGRRVLRHTLRNVP